MKRNSEDIRQVHLDSLDRGRHNPTQSNQNRQQNVQQNVQQRNRQTTPQMARRAPQGGQTRAYPQSTAANPNAVRSRAQSSAGNANTTMNINPNSRKPGRRKKLTGKKIFLRIMLALLAVIVLLGIAGLLYKNHLENQITYIPQDMNPTFKDEDGSIVSLSDVATETTKEALPVLEGIHNILLIGIDSRSTTYTKDGSGNLADIIMILTVNENDSTLKLTGVQRDSYVYVPGYTDPQKINAAMTYGGPQLLVHVLENHLRIDLEQYAFVDMNHMEKVIDAVGGVTVNVSESERSSPLGGLNELVAEQNVEFGSNVSAHMLYDTGVVTLDGRQAVAYARIRKVGNGDYERSQRQIEVMESLLHRFMDLGITSKASVIEKVLSLISTNMTKSDLEGYVLTVLPNITSAEFEFLQLPVSGYANEGTYSDFRDGEWSIRPNWNGMIPLVQQFMFNQTFAFDTVRIIPEAPVATPTPTPAEEDTQAGGN